MEFVVRVSPEADSVATRVLAEIAARGDRHSRWGAREQ
jgi:hypothetical protein